jgi:colanic acid biosynthesis glycosyl transferase WcaI
MVNRRPWHRRDMPAQAKDRGILSRQGLPAGWRGIDPEENPVRSPSILGVAPAGETQGKRILFINQYYWPDHASTAQHLTDLAESFASRGYKCHVLASQGRYKPGEPRPAAYEVHNGVHIHRVPATSLGRRGTWARMTDYLSFYAGAVVKALLLPRFDAVVTLTTPPIIGLVGTLLKRFKKTRHVYWSMDLHPDASLALGRMSSRSILGRSMSWLSGFVYRHADQVVALGPYMEDRITVKGVAPDRIATIPVWSERDEIYPTPRDSNPLRKSLGLEKAFVAMYSGNLGLAHSFDEFIDAARRLRDRTDIVFLYVGEGPRLVEVKEARDREDLSNIRFLDYVPRSQLQASLGIADVHLISMRPEMTGIVVPGKLYGVMAAGRPALFVGPEHCEPADTIRDAGCGITVTPGDADGLLAALVRLASNPSLARRMGEKGRSAFLIAHDRKICCAQWHELIGDLVTRPEPSGRPLVPTTPRGDMPRRAAAPFVTLSR